MRVLRQVPLAARVARRLPHSAAFRSVPTLSLGVAKRFEGDKLGEPCDRRRM